LFNDGRLDITAGVAYKETPTLADVTVNDASTSVDVINTGPSTPDDVAGKEMSGNGGITGLTTGEVEATFTLYEDIGEVRHISVGTTGNDTSVPDNICHGWCHRLLLT
jgi:hypothetical protein